QPDFLADRIAAKQHATQLGRGVLEREVHMPARLRPEVRHFTANPAAPHPRLEHLFHTSCKHGYRFDGTVGGEIEKRHGSNVDCGLRIADCGLGVWTRPSYACFNRMLK